jgi:DNA-binding transcriptional regulator YdaS (Cro superfamily)
MVELDSSELDALLRSIEVAGSQSALARLLCCSTTSVWKMVNKAGRMSHEYVLKAEAETGVSRHELRPDIYPIENSGASCTPEAAPAAVSELCAAGDRNSPLQGLRS